MEPSKILRASTSVDVNICKIQKATNFTHFTPKIFHISPSKTVHILYLHICYSNRAYIHGYYSCVSYYFINFSFRSLFSLSSPFAKTTQTFSLPHHLLLPLIHTNKPTQRHTKTHGPFNACGSVLQWRS